MANNTNSRRKQQTKEENRKRKKTRNTGAKKENMNKMESQCAGRHTIAKCVCVCMKESAFAIGKFNHCLCMCPFYSGRHHRHNKRPVLTSQHTKASATCSSRRYKSMGPSTSTHTHTTTMTNAREHTSRLLTTLVNRVDNYIRIETARARKVHIIHISLRHSPPCL